MAAVLLANLLPQHGRVFGIESDARHFAFSARILGVAGYVDKVALYHGEPSDVMPGITKGIDFVFLEAQSEVVWVPLEASLVKRKYHVHRIGRRKERKGCTAVTI